MSRKILLAIAIVAFGLSAAADEAFGHVSFSERCDELFKAWEDQRGPGQKAAFLRDGDYLVAGILGMGKKYIFAVSDHEFFDSSRSLAVAFEMGRGGRAQRAVITLGEDEMAAERIDLGDAARKLVQDISGTYYSEALGAACSIVDRDGGTYLSRRRYEDLGLAVVDSENLVSTWGFMSFVRDDSGVLTGFNLIEEVFGMKPVRFVKVAH